MSQPPVVVIAENTASKTVSEVDAPELTGVPTPGSV